MIGKCGATQSAAPFRFEIAVKNEYSLSSLLISRNFYSQHEKIP